MAIDNDSRRILLRGRLETFRTAFFEDAANTIPATPLDAGLYPSYTIYDIDNQVIQSGLGQPEATPGQYKVEFNVPTDAKLSQDLQRWRIDWVLVTDNNQQLNFTEEFEVLDTVITASETREQMWISLPEKEFRASVRMPMVVPEISIDVFIANTSSKVVDNVGLGAGGIQRAPDGDSIVYYYDIPGNRLIPNCFYQIIWNFRNNVTEPLQFIHQSLTIISPSVLNLVTAVRMLIDRLQKRLGTVQAYEDSDIVQALQRGHELVNSIYPTTTFSFGSLPPVLTVYHVLASSWYLLSAQHILEVELGINFSGQTVTLDYDHTSGISEALGKMQEFVNSTLPATKLGLIRRNTPVGTVAGRNMRYFYEGIVYKVSSTQGASNIIQQLTTLGILF